MSFIVLNNFHPRLLISFIVRASVAVFVRATFCRYEQSLGRSFICKKLTNKGKVCASAVHEGTPCGVAAYQWHHTNDISQSLIERSFEDLFFSFYLTKIVHTDGSVSSV